MSNSPVLPTSMSLAFDVVDGSFNEANHHPRHAAWHCLAKSKPVRAQNLKELHPSRFDLIAASESPLVLMRGPSTTRRSGCTRTILTHCIHATLNLHPRNRMASSAHGKFPQGTQSNQGKTSRGWMEYAGLGRRRRRGAYNAVANPGPQSNAQPADVSAIEGIG